MRLKTTHIRWQPSWRIIAERYPPINFFERVADPMDWEALLELTKQTDPSAENVGDIQLIPPADRISGPGTGRVLPSFTFLSPPPGSRFSNNQFGAYYAARQFDTASAETIFHLEKFLLDGNVVEPQDIDHLIILADIIGIFHDIRGQQVNLPDVYHLTDYTAAQALAKSLKDKQSFGISYSSLRHTNGECVAVFRPLVISNIRQGDKIAYSWNGCKIIGYYRKSDFSPI